MREFLLYFRHERRHESDGIASDIDAFTLSNNNRPVMDPNDVTTWASGLFNRIENELVSEIMEV